MSQPLLSVVTVTCNDEQGLSRTLRSLVRLQDESAGEVEVLVQNGGDPEAVVQLVSAYPWVESVSEPDLGIYDAMNRATRRARGKYVWYLNGGDEVGDVSWADIRSHLTREVGMFFFDYVRVFEGAGEYRRARSASYLRHALPTSHQAIIYPKMVDVPGPYRPDLLSADYELTARLWKDGILCVPVHLPLARFHAGGASTSRAKQIALDAALVQEEILGLGRGWRVWSRTRHTLARVVFQLKLSVAKKRIS